MSRSALIIIAALVVLSLAAVDMRCAWARVPVRAAASKCDRSKFRVILDVGHTREAPGAISARNVPEFEFNLHLATRIEERLKSDGFAQASVLVSEGPARPSLLKRAATIDESRPDLALSIHHDSVPDSFLEDWDVDGKPGHFSDRFSGYSLFVSHANPKFKASLRFARLLGRQMKAKGLQYAHQYAETVMGRYQRKLLDRRVGVYRYDELIVLGRTHVPAVLLEAGSIINRNEELAMGTPERQDMISAAVAGAVLQFCASR